MAENSKIEWCHHTFNPWRGCTKISEGCEHCYAETLSLRNPKVLGQWGKGKPRVLASEAMWKEPLKWNRELKYECPSCGQVHVPEKPLDGCWECDCSSGGTICHPIRPRVFCASLSDWLDDEVPIEWLVELMSLIRHTPNLDWLLLTKRPQNFKPRLNAALKRILKATGGEPCNDADFIDGWVNKRDTIPQNVWIGATAENQRRFDERYMALAEIPARVRFWSMEPLLGSIDFTAVHYDFSFKAAFHWVITGGESGGKNTARHCHTDDLRDIVSQCDILDVPCFVKQLGSNAVAAGRDQRHLIAMKHPKGGDWSEWPEALRVRQFPQIGGTAHV